MDADLWIHTKDEMPLDVVGLPHQMLDPMLQAAAARARTQAAPERTSHAGLAEIDTHVWKKARKGLRVHADRNLASSLAAGGVWSQTAKAAIAGDIDTRCKLCGKHDDGVFHIPCECSAMQDIRSQYTNG